MLTEETTTGAGDESAALTLDELEEEVAELAAHIYLRAGTCRWLGGELSYANVRALTRVAEERSEEELLELARYLTAAQLERALRAYRRVTREEARDVHR